ncbi:MAG: mucoidy inhibitor MuiA family protein [Promethearchaeota archaeon]
MTEIKTRVQRVAVFRDGARVSRSGTAKLDAGPHKVLVKGITSYAQEDSFRVKGRGPAALSTIDVRRTEVVFDPKEDVKPLYEKLKKLEKSLQKANDEIETQNQRLTNIRGMVGDFAGTFGMLFAASEAKIEQLIEMDSKSDNMVDAIKKKLRDLTEQRKEIQDQINVLRSNIGQIESKRRTDSFYEVEISLEARDKAEVELDVTYQVSGANWIPSYDVDLHPGRAKVRRMALVTNTTREDWEKVGLIVSTATARPVEAVEGSPLIITAYDPEMLRRRRDERRRLSSSIAMKKEKAMPRPVAAAPGAAPPPAPPPEIVEEFAEASETASGISVYELPKPVSIPSDNERHPVTLIEEEFDSNTIHYWYADGMAEVVAQDEITNGDTVLLPGGAKVYAEGDYIGETSISLMSPREKFKLGTRTAYDVKATKKLIDREVEKAGITRGKLRRAYKYRLEIESFSKRPVKMEVFDRIPHSLNPSIEVKADWNRFNMRKQELGIIEWNIALEPKEKRNIDYDYEVEWERNVTINPPLP